MALLARIKKITIVVPCCNYCSKPAVLVPLLLFLICVTACYGNENKKSVSIDDAVPQIKFDCK